MADDELAAFRDSWKQEITSKKEEKRLASASTSSWSVPDQRDLKNRYFEDLKNSSKEQSTTCSSSKSDAEGCVDEGKGGKSAGEWDDQPEYVSIARSLLDGRTSPLLDRIQEERQKRKRQYQNMTVVYRTSLNQQPERKVKKDEELVDLLIQDLV